MSRTVAALCGLFVLAACPVLAADEFTPLFDGKTLEGWDGDAELWKVTDGVIVGSTHDKQIKKNSFLSTKKTYKNFVLKVKFKLHNGNSGIQFRSQQHPEYVVKGYQADIADNQFMGILYSEGTGRGILANVNKEEVAKHVNKGDWNEYVITVNGNKIKQELNGHTTIEFEDKDEQKAVHDGIIALQLHVGPKMVIEFKDIAIKELP